MLVLTRKRDEDLVIGGGESGFPEVVVRVVDIRGDKVRLGIEAPSEVPVDRLEVRRSKEVEGVRTQGPRGTRFDVTV